MKKKGTYFCSPINDSARVTAKLPQKLPLNYQENIDKTLKKKQVPLREPDLLMVITGGELAYTREDGVKVIPLACLKW